MDEAIREMRSEKKSETLAAGEASWGTGLPGKSSWGVVFGPRPLAERAPPSRALVAPHDAACGSVGATSRRTVSPGCPPSPNWPRVQSSRQLDRSRQGLVSVVAPAPDRLHILRAVRPVSEDATEALGRRKRARGARTQLLERNGGVSGTDFLLSLYKNFGEYDIKWNVTSSAPGS
jgi:hypothetical protein